MPSTPQLPHCYLQRVAYKEPVTEAQPHGLTSFDSSWEGLLQSLPPCVLLLAGTQPLGSGSRRKFGSLPGREEDSPLRDCATDTEMLMRALLS